MYFLIGVIILIVFIVCAYIYFKIRIRNTLDRFGFVGMNLKDIIDQARLEDQEVPKSLSSMDSIYLEQIKKDFPDLNINELKREAEKTIIDCYNAIEIKSSSGFKGKIKSFINSIINDYKNKDVKIDNFKIHNTVISSYKKEKGVATIYFASSYEYYLSVDGKSTKTQDRCKCEFIYVYDIDKVDSDLKLLGLNCPNCGAPIKSLGNKSCAYCSSSIIDVFKKVFTCNDVVRY